MQLTPRQKKAAMLVVLLCSPWLLCQTWIAVGAPDEALLPCQSVPTTVVIVHTLEVMQCIEWMAIIP